MQLRGEPCGRSKRNPMPVGIDDREVADSVWLICGLGSGPDSSIKHCLVDGVDIGDTDEQSGGTRDTVVVFAEVKYQRRSRSLNVEGETVGVAVLPVNLEAQGISVESRAGPSVPNWQNRDPR